MSNTSQPLIENETKLGLQQKQVFPSGKAYFKKYIEIDLDKKLPQYSDGYSTAFQARDTAEGKNLVAFICDPTYAPRMNKALGYTQVLNPSLPQLILAGVIELPEKAGQRLAFFYEDTIGKPLFTPQPGLPLAFGWRPDKVLERVIEPTLTALRDLRMHDIVHGGIRIDNLFDGGRDKNAGVTLGECLSSPASIAQPILFESLERAMCMPSGRGEGMAQDDLYALGVVVAILLRTKDPLAKRKNDTEILVSKMVNGTYASLISPDDHIGGTLLEFIRGTLIDDGRQRWTLDEALTWLDGKRLSPKQATKKKKALRSIQFNGRNIFYAEFLAREFILFPNETAVLADTSDLDQWIDRSLNDTEMLARYDKAMKSAQDSSRGPMYAERLASRLAIALDPDAPIRFRNLAFTLDGLGGALAEAFTTGRELNTFAEIISSGLIQFYLGILAEMNYDVASHSTKHEAVKNFIKHNSLGFGLERILYHLNEDIQCLSPLVARYFVRSPEDFIQALEIVLQDDNGKTKTILDRHSVAFLASKENKLIDPYLYEISSPQPFRQVLGTIQILGGIQRYYKTPPSPNICRWLLPQLDLVIDRYHDAHMREDIRLRVKKFVELGDLARLHLTVDSQEQWARDVYNFRRAIGEYRQLEKEKSDLRVKMRDPKKFGAKHGRETSIVIAGIIASLVMLGFIVLFMSGSKFP